MPINDLQTLITITLNIFSSDEVLKINFSSLHKN